MLEIARQCLAQGATLVYGGDLRPSGLTENLLDLVRHHNDAIHKVFNPVVNYLAWPLKSTLDTAWAAQNKDAIKIRHSDAPADLKQAGLIKDIPAGGDISGISAYLWARCLTAMREEIVEKTQARIMLGGKTLDYKGKYPGLVEEALLTLQANKPLYLLGGYGGMTQVIIQALLGQNPKTLTQDYQCADVGYQTLMEDYNLQIKEQQLAIEPIDYKGVSQTLADMGISGLNNGLKDEENLILFSTVNMEEAVGLIMMGLANLTNTSPQT